MLIIENTACNYLKSVNTTWLAVKALAAYVRIECMHREGFSIVQNFAFPYSYTVG